MMTDDITKKWKRSSFVLSLIFHLALLLLLLNFSSILSWNPFKKVEIEKKPPHLYIPSYVYHGAMTPNMQHTKPQQPSPSQTVMESETRSPSVAKAQENPGMLSSQPKHLTAKTNNPFQHKSIMDMSRSIIQQSQASNAISNMNNSEPPILMVGDRHAIVDPLAKLLGRSLSAHFRYPDIEGRFGAQGRVFIELVLHPEGYFSDVQIVQSSDIQDFNTAALYAVNTAPTVVGASKFLSQPKRFVVGFIFE